LSGVVLHYSANEKERPNAKEDSDDFLSDLRRGRREALRSYYRAGSN
jgi:hypothetical protein